MTDNRPVLQRLYEDGIDCPRRDEYVDELTALADASLGAAIARDKEYVSTSIKLAFALGFRAGREEARPDVFREALDDERF